MIKVTSYNRTTGWEIAEISGVTRSQGLLSLIEGIVEFLADHFPQATYGCLDSTTRVLAGSARSQRSLQTKASAAATADHKLFATLVLLNTWARL